jgi:ring-1,2-phenylacetyl-CoA epoxidase subunit PaaC
MPLPLYNYLLHLGDNALILGHRNSEWCGHGPVLEQDIALTNIALDLIGQARLFYQYAAECSGDGTTEDTIAYLRDAYDFRNCLLVEQPNGDWACTIVRQFLFSAYQYELYRVLRHSKDSRLAAIATKALKEVTYHLRWSGEWVVRLGDGTQESHSRMLNAISELWMFTGELFRPAPYEKDLSGEGISVSPGQLEAPWTERLNAVFTQAGLEVPVLPAFQSGGKTGIHSEHLGYLLAELQFLQRAYPGSTW